MQVKQFTGCTQNGTAMSLRPYQFAAVDATLDAIDRRQPSGLLSMPTGCGKTVTFATLAERLRWPTLVIAHREELLTQAEGTFRRIWPGVRVGIIRGERDEWNADLYGRAPDVVIASVASLHAKRLQRIPRNRFRLIIADECHHAVADSWVRAIEHFDARFVLGCTATPERADGKALAAMFGERPLFSFPLRSAIVQGFLARLTQYAVETTADLDGVSKRTGDLADGELARAVNTPARNRVVLEAWQAYAADRRTLAFAVDVQHAIDLAETFIAKGIAAATVTGETPRDERKQMLADFAVGRIRVLNNCAVLTEGFDDPEISAILMARPTCSRTLYQQCIGRGLRLAPGKTDALILDFVDNSKRHKLVSVLDLLGAPHARNARGRDVLDVVDADQAEAERRHEIETLRPLAWRLAAICPWPELPTLAGYVACEQWHFEKASDKQLAYLGSFGVDAGRELTRGEASHLIDRLRECEAVTPVPATDKQVYCLQHAGLWRAGMGKREASRLIGELKSMELATS